MGHPSPVLRRLPWIYGAILVVETAWLLWRYLTAPPEPSGPLSVWLGWGGLGSMIVMLIYSVARRSRMFRQWARLSYWLHLHIFLGVQGTVMVIFHSWPMFTREGGAFLLNPGVLNFIAVMVVFVSGLVGRYLYSLLPRQIGGEQMAAREVEAELSAMEAPLPEAVVELWSKLPPPRTFANLMNAKRATRAALKTLASLDLDEEVRALAHRRVLLERRKVQLTMAQRIFRNWIILHRPIAALMYVLSFVHVALAYMFSPSLGV